MASAKKKGKKVSRAKKKTSKGAVRSIKDSASGFIDQVEKQGSALAGEVKELFDTLTEKVSDMASTAAERNAPVRYPRLWNISPRVVNSLPSAVAPLIRTPLVRGKTPVSSDACDGRVSGTWHNACSNNTADSANLSSAGVCACGYP